MTNEILPQRVAVIGGGITGLMAAYQLQRARIPVTLFEASPRVGGAISSVRTGEWLHELGPNSLLENSTRVGELLDELGLGVRHLYAAPEAKQRYIVRGGRLVAMPTSPMGFVTTPLFSWKAKFNLLGEPWRVPHKGSKEESVADFVVRRLGREFLDYAINPFVGGVYAGDPRSLSVRHAFPKLDTIEQQHGSLIRGALKMRNTSGGPKGRIFSFPEGLTELPEALRARLNRSIELRTRVRSMRYTSSGWRIQCEQDGLCGTEDFTAVICALPAGALAGLNIEGVSGVEALSALHEIHHPPVASVFTGFAREQVQHPLDGFGVLMPEVEQGGLLGTLFSSSLFPHRAPAGHVALTSFVGGSRQPELARLDDGALLERVESELHRLLGVSGAPVFTRIQRWPRAIPQYTLGYQRFKDLLARVESNSPGLFIGGNCRDGIALGNCIASGERLAKAAREFVRRPGVDLARKVRPELAGC